MIKLLVIADDLTGALDAGVHFAERGIITEVIPVFSNATLNSVPDASVEVMVVNTESRHIPAENAARRVSLAARFGADHGATFIYKKTDSTLRGNIGAELEGLMKATGTHRIPFIPAYPALSRFTMKGYHYLGDQLLHHTRFAEDPLEPVTSSYIPEILAFQTHCSIRVLSFPMEQDDPFKAGNGCQILTFDCASNQDLEQIGDFLERKDQLRIVAGSAGFAPVLASKIPFSRARELVKINYRNCLIINGSLNPVSLAQIEKLERKRINHLYLEPKFLHVEHDRPEKWENLVNVVQKKLQQNPNLVIGSTGSRRELMDFLKNHFKQPIPKDVYANAARRFADFITTILERIDIGMMIIMGGDTLMALTDKMGMQVLYPVREVMPGVVLSRAEIGDRRVYLVTKPGGYGDEGTLITLLEYFKNQKL